MKDEFKEKAGEIADALKAVNNNGAIAEDLEIALEEITFSEQTIQSIKDVSSPTFKDQFEVTGKLALTMPQMLAHAFKDPIEKNIISLNTIKRFDVSDARSLKALLDTKRCLEDINHNYPILLGKKMIGSIENTFEQYDEIISDLELVIDKLSKSTGIDPDDIEEPGDGIESFSKLPEDFSL